MENLFKWNFTKEFRGVNNLLSPSPVIFNENVYVFFGIQSNNRKDATLGCIRIHEDFSEQNFEIRYAFTGEHSVSNGNLPNSLFTVSGLGQFLICAEFTDSIQHKHRLVTHLHRIEFFDDFCLIHERTDFNFINYESDEFHTLAGMSRHENEYYFVRGQEWELDGSHNTPITSLYKYSIENQTERKINVALEGGDLAIARPVRLDWHKSKLLFLSVRTRGGGYGSRGFQILDNSLLRVIQSFHFGSSITTESSLAYEYPFIWMNQLWCICTRDYRGSVGFQLFQLGEML
jgi:hypothetical protein